MSETNYILAIDPGGTTGYCHGEYNGTTLLLRPGQKKFSGSELYKFLEESWQKNFYVIYEQFHYRNKARAGLDLTPANLIGVIELFCEKEGVNHFAQMPSEGKGYWTDDQLRRFQVYVPGLQHGRDAMRHLLQWWQFKFGFGIHKISPFTNYKVEAIK